MITKKTATYVIPVKQRFLKFTAMVSLKAIATNLRYPATSALFGSPIQIVDFTYIPNIVKK